MSNKGQQEINGKAFEFCIIIALNDFLKENGASSQIIEEHNFINAKSKFGMLDQKDQDLFLKSARRAIEHISELEPLILNPKTEDLTLSLQSDSKGRSGDVRDVLLVRSNQGWEIGISAKNNNIYIKSPRLSPKKDFFLESIGIESSQTYKDEMSKVFSIIEKNLGKTWSEAFSSEEKVSLIYKPVLDSLVAEIGRLAKENAGFAEKITKYLLGTQDFYKVIRKKNVVTVEALNIHGTLNKAYEGIKPKIKVSLYSHPNIVEKTSFKIKNGQTNTVVIYFDNGLSLSLRVHSGDTKVKKTGLKLEVAIEGYPKTLYKNNIFC